MKKSGKNELEASRAALVMCWTLEDDVGIKSIQC